MSDELHPRRRRPNWRRLRFRNLLRNWLGSPGRRGRRMSKRAVAPVPIPPLDPITITKKTSKKFKKLVSWQALF